MSHISNRESERLLRELPDYFSKDEHSNNSHLIEAIGRQLVELQDGIESVDNATSVQRANSIEEIFELAKMIQLPPLGGESRERYRTRTIAEYQLVTNEGTASDLINSIAVLLNVAPTQIRYRDSDEPGVAIVGVPLQGVSRLDIDTSELVEIIQNNAAAGFRIEANVRGTFTYVTPHDYENYESVADLGYDALDTSGNPEESGGTYAGLLE